MTAWVVGGDVVAAAHQLAPDRTVVALVPRCDTRGYDLGADRLVWPVVVDDEAAAVEVLEAVLRGVAVVVRVEGNDPQLRARLIDELRRAVGPDGSPPPLLAAGLSEDQLALLRALGAGATLATAAAACGMAVRSASRRLAEARRVLGVTSTVEAVLAVTRLGPAARPTSSSTSR